MSDQQVKHDVMRFLLEDAGFAQVVTVNRAGFPVSRTMGAPINEDWSVDLVQRRVHHRLGQLADNPRLEIIWVGTPAPGSRNDQPAVYDFGLLVPRVVLVRGIAQFMDAEWTIERYNRQSRRLRDKGFTKAPQRSVENVREELVGIHVNPLRVRAEGFGVGAEAFTWTIEELM